MVENNSVCKHHSGFKARIENTEANVKTLWKKWDRLTIVMLLTLGGVVANLIIEFFRMATK